MKPFVPNEAPQFVVTRRTQKLVETPRTRQFNLQSVTKQLMKDEPSKRVEQLEGLQTHNGDSSRGIKQDELGSLFRSLSERLNECLITEIQSGNLKLEPDDKVKRSLTNLLAEDRSEQRKGHGVPGPKSIKKIGKTTHSRGIAGSKDPTGGSSLDEASEPLQAVEKKGKNKNAKGIVRSKSKSNVS